MDVIRARAVMFDHIGEADVLDLRSTDVPPPGPDEVRIRVKAFGLNRSESYYRAGFFDLPEEFPARLGYEAAGVVESVGTQVNGIGIGDRVATLPAIEVCVCGAYGELMNVPARYVVPSPPELSDEEVAALWSSYMTAYGMTVDLVNIREGDWVLVTAASSSLGPPTIQMVRMLGGRVIATTRKREKAEAIRAMGAEHVIVTDEEDLAARIRASTRQEGVQFVFDPIGGPIVEPLIECLMPYGTLVLYGIMDFDPVNLPVHLTVANNLSIHGYAMMLADKPERNREAIDFIRDGVRRGLFRPLIDSRFPLDRFSEAISRFEAQHHVGKVVVIPDA